MDERTILKWESKNTEFQFWWILDPACQKYILQTWIVNMAWNQTKFFRLKEYHLFAAKFGRNGRVSSEGNRNWNRIKSWIKRVDRSCRFGKNTFSRKITQI